MKPEHKAATAPGTAGETERQLSAMRHRIRNNLQGLAGLLGLAAARRPEAADALQEAIRHVHALARVYVRHVPQDSDLRFGMLVRDLGEGLRELGLGELVQQGVAPDEDWLLAEDDAATIALVVNELIWSALALRDPATQDPVTVRVAAGAQTSEACLSVRSRRRPGPEAGGAALRQAAGFSIEFMRALLPRGSAALDLRSEEGGWLCAELRLRAPALRRSPP